MHQVSISIGNKINKLVPTEMSENVIIFGVDVIFLVRSDGILGD